MRTRTVSFMLVLLSTVPVVGCASREAMLTLPIDCTTPQFAFLERKDGWIDTTVRFSCPKIGSVDEERPAVPPEAPRILGELREKQ